MGDDFVALADAAARLHTDYNVAWRAVVRHAVPTRRVGRLLRVDFRALAAALDLDPAGRR